MALSDALEGKPPDTVCRWRSLLERMPSDDADAADKMMEGWHDPEYGPQPPLPVYKILHHLRAEKYQIGDDVPYFHRRGECSCR